MFYLVSYTNLTYTQQMNQCSFKKKINQKNKAKLPRIGLEPLHYPAFNCFYKLSNCFFTKITTTAKLVY